MASCGANLRLNSRRSSTRLAIICRMTPAAEMYQIVVRSNPGCRDSTMIGMAISVMRTNEVNERRQGVSDRLEHARRDEHHARGDEVPRDDAQVLLADRDHLRVLREDADQRRRRDVADRPRAPPFTATAIPTAERNVARTRSAWRAPKFWPATGATAKPSATTGRNIAWMSRRPMPNPACAAAPNGRLIAVDDEQVDGHERELGAGGQADLEHARPRLEARRPVGRSGSAGNASRATK